jgi:hypothetical protein
VNFMERKKKLGYGAIKNLKFRIKDMADFCGGKMVLHLVLGCPLSLRALMVSKAAGLGEGIDYQLYFGEEEMRMNKRVQGMNGGGQGGPVLETTQGSVYGINSIAKLLVNSPKGKEVGLMG